ncbi:MAG: GDYXXLXY domain-containing protein [Helicobacteraceae bacterium]|jgi:uncharacterized membrane-anchored protein|nr:GDYXXLXY domain-containing protein [Helicobacteraceae bacterium]
MNALELLRKYQTKILLAALGAVVFFQLFACAFQIVKYERRLSDGRRVILLMQTYDPYDAFRGRYATLRIESPAFSTNKKLCKESCARSFFVTYKAELNDRNLSVIDDVFIDKPDTDLAYLELQGNYDPQRGVVWLTYNFDRFYLQEDIAKAVDRNAGLLTGNNNARVIIRVLNGKGVIEEVMVGNQTLIEYIREQEEDL